MANKDGRQELQKQLSLYSRNLDHLLRQAATYGGEAMVPLRLMHEIAAVREEIAQLEERLRMPTAEEQGVSGSKLPVFPAPLPEPPAPTSTVVGALRITLALRAGKWLMTVENSGAHDLSSVELQLHRPSMLYINPEKLRKPRLPVGAHFEHELTITSRGAVSPVRLPVSATYFPSALPRQEGTLTIVLPEN